MNRREALTWITTELSQLYSAEQAPVLARQLLSWALDLSQAQLLAQSELPVPDKAHDLLSQALHDHCTNHKPLQYIMGSVPFLSATIKVRPPILIPRPETEAWVADLIAHLEKLPNKELTLLDMCTGSGCISIALAQALQEATIYAVDISPEALALTQENAYLNDCTNIKTVQSDLFTALPSSVRFDAIISNPPYVTPQEWETLEPHITQWEDPGALRAGDEGLALIKRLITETPHRLKENSEMQSLHIPQLYIEIGEKQGQAVADLMKKARFTATVQKDDAGKDRLVCGELDAK